MIKRGLFKQAALDDGEEFIIMSSQAYGEYRAAREQESERERDLRAAQASAKEREAKLEPPTRDVLSRGEQFIAQIRKSNEEIDDAVISEKLDCIEHVVGSILERVAENPETAPQLDRMMDYYLPTTEEIDDAVISEKLDCIEHVVGSILERVAENPETAPQLDRMMDYYLPTTVKLLEAYRTLDEAAVETTSVANSKREIASTLDMLHEAFEKLLDTLFRDVAWDVSTDISVLRTMLAQDGLTKGAFEGDSSPEAR